MSAPQTVLEFRDLIERSGVLSADVLAPFFSASSTLLDLRAIADRLVADGLLTPYHVSLFSSGKIDGFFLNDKYKLLDFIGEGGVGKVYLCEHLILQRLVAVKLLRILAGESGQTDPSAEERFYREARAIAALDHRNIVRVFDVDRIGRNPYMVMEYMDGTNLHQIVSRHGSLSIERAAACIAQAAAGLDHAHRAGLVHRDVKPSNLLLDRQGIVKLLDLGLARFCGDASRNQAITDRFDTNVVLGTVDYMAPEQAIDTSKADIRADIYSLGCTWYFLLTGRPPFAAGNIPQRMYAHQTQAPEPISLLCPKLPEAQSAIIHRMLEKESARRFQTPSEIVQAMHAFTPESPAVPPSDEMPRAAASYYRLGVSNSSSSAVTPHPMPREETQKLPRDDPFSAAASSRPHEPSNAPRDSNRLPPAPVRMEKPPRKGRLTLYLCVAGLAIAVIASIIWRGATQWDSNPDSKSGPKTAPIDSNSTSSKDGGQKNPTPFTGTILSGGGSTFVKRLMEVWARVYEKNQNVRINYASVGSGKGAQGVIDRVYLFGCSDAPLSDEQMATAEAAGGKLLHIPLAMGAVVTTYNLPDVKQQLRFSGPILADIYLGKITRWNDAAIRINNPGVNLPNMPISVVHRADNSGTTFIWTDFLGKVSGDWKEKLGSGKTELKWPVGDEEVGNDGVATRVSRNIGAIGYVELSFALENNLPFAQIKNRAKKFIEPKLESVTAAGAASLHHIPGDLRYSLTDAPGDDSYPIAGTTWAIVHVNQSSNPKARELVEFLRWATREGQAYVKELRLAPLPPELVKLIDDKLATVELTAPKVP